jgi:hypothetical protein
MDLEYVIELEGVTPRLPYPDIRNVTSFLLQERPWEGTRLDDPVNGSMGQSPYWESNSCLAGQEIPHFLYKFITMFTGPYREPGESNPHTHILFL